MIQEFLFQVETKKKQKWSVKFLRIWFWLAQTIIFHQLRCSWNKGISIPQLHFGGPRLCEVPVIWPGVGHRRCFKSSTDLEKFFRFLLWGPTEKAAAAPTPGWLKTCVFVHFFMQHDTTSSWFSDACLVFWGVCVKRWSKDLLQNTSFLNATIFFCFRKQVTLHGNVGYFSRLPPTPKNESCGIIASCCLLGTLSRPEGRSNTILFQVWPKLCFQMWNQMWNPPKSCLKKFSIATVDGK